MSGRCTRNREGYVVCYTGGACTRNGQDGAQAGIGVYFGDGHRWNISERVHPRCPQMSDTAEIQAAVEAVYLAKENREYKLEINSDSDLMIQGITKSIYEWERNGWIDDFGDPVENQDDFLDLRDAIKKMEDVVFVYVPSHAGSNENKQAEKLAREGARSNYYFDWRYGTVMMD